MPQVLYIANSKEFGLTVSPELTNTQMLTAEVIIRVSSEDSGFNIDWIKQNNEEFDVRPIGELPAPGLTGFDPF